MLDALSGSKSSWATLYTWIFSLILQWIIWRLFFKRENERMSRPSLPLYRSRAPLCPAAPGLNPVAVGVSKRREPEAASIGVNWSGLSAWKISLGVWRNLSRSWAGEEGRRHFGFIGAIKICQNRFRLITIRRRDWNSFEGSGKSPPVLDSFKKTKQLEGIILKMLWSKC